MELVNIEKLVHKYLEAETTLQEEKELRNYFSSGNVAPHLQEYQMLFGYFLAEKDETYTKTIQLEPENSIKKKNWRWLSVAATVALLFGTYFGYEYYEKRRVTQQYAQVMEALHLVSSNLKKGNEAVASLYTYENTVNKILKTK